MNSENVPNVPEKSGEVIIETLPKTISPALKWCFTMNNYTKDDILLIVPIFNRELKSFIFECEVGENGTPHLQGYIHFKTKRRPFDLHLPSMNWIKCKGTEQDNITYCSKDFRDGKTKEIYKSNNINIPRPLKIISILKPWQVKLEAILLTEPDDRKIIWVYEDIGNVGKSAFSKYMVVKYDALYVTEGKKSDIINIVYNYVINQDLNILILDVPRDNGNKISYKSLEEIKNGLICNTKYETGNKVINAPHVVVFSNEPPDTFKFSLDRWEIYNIKNNELILIDEI